MEFEGDLVKVVFVAKKDAKRVKDWLKVKDGMLSDQHRMCSSTDEQFPDCIAIPVISSHLDMNVHENNDILGGGLQQCPLKSKSSQFGSQSKQYHAELQSKEHTQDIDTRYKFNKIQETLLYVLDSMSIKKIFGAGESETLMLNIDKLCEAECPSKLQFFGDDRTLVLSEKALDYTDETSSFARFLASIVDDQQYDQFMDQVYAKLANDCRSFRIIRRCRIDANSGIRESNFAILWPRQDSIASLPRCGPKSLKWITVTENGIRQSFNLTRVMFCRGNYSEKLRFGTKLVQPDEVVLDMYAGIGYFTLPALVHGKARHVVACEWNDHAAEALRYNLVDNGVQARATVYVGDCRIVAKEQGLVNMFDRVSLGLLPSSEGGWATAVRALKRATGGWLHVHGNVPVKEANSWLEWLCIRVLDCARKEGLVNWVVLGSHLEKVKSFAPTVNHYVADVWLGPASQTVAGAAEMSSGTAAVVVDGRVVILNATVAAPSCALSDEGALCQAWMR
ncbi:hypothetical protein MPSEU_000210300 [Mayamaea pseudoterrestris]|nr:hypothetical protein MPSEU_000210300 [Mayamaea pseudoterrestris]